jgi:hypothetical protein
MSELQTPANPTQEDDEINLLDLFVTITDNLRLLVLGPLLAGLLAFGVGSVTTPVYESRSVLRLGKDSTALFASEELLTPLLPVATWLPVSPSGNAQLQALRAHIKPSFNQLDETHAITVTAPSAEQAQRLHIALIDELRKQPMPKDQAEAFIRQRLTIAHATLDELNTVLPTLSKDVARPGTKSDAILHAYNLLLQQRLSTMQTVQELASKLQALSDDAIVQAPSLPDKPVKPKKALMAIITALATGFALLLFVFIRQAVRNAASNPEDAARLAAIRRNLARSVSLQRT